jgi:hypothetical protein
MLLLLLEAGGSMARFSGEFRCKDDDDDDDA